MEREMLLDERKENENERMETQKAWATVNAMNEMERGETMASGWWENRRQLERWRGWGCDRSGCHRLRSAFLSSRGGECGVNDVSVESDGGSSEYADSSSSWASLPRHKVQWLSYE